ncbi:MAG: universal stress protein [Deltaproteobacteria bacterium]|nr:universal stress protein [Deltaproteobacteria bacterium]
MIKNILFATDLSDNSRHAFKYAANLANQYQATLVIFHVMEGLSDNFKNRVSSFLGQEAWEHIRDAKETGVRKILIGKKTERQVLKNALNRISKQLQADGQLDPFEADEIIVGEGQNVAKEIRLTARDKKCDTIVMSGRGESLLDKASLGRRTKDVLKRANVPVFVVPPIK